MKIFHLSDLHIGLKLFNRDLYEDQRYVFAQIVEYAKTEQPDAVIVAGDIYDKAIPSAEGVELFDQFISELSAVLPRGEVMLISGNHDSAPRINVFRRVLKDRKIHMIGLPPLSPQEHIERIVLEDEWGEVSFYLLPFVKPSMVKAIVGTDENDNTLSYDETLHRLIDREAVDVQKRNVLVSHQFYLPVSADPDSIERMDTEIRTVGNVDAVRGDVLERFDYAALGHIHKPMKVGSENYRYCGTPLACSVSEAGQQKGIVLVEMKEKGNVQTRVLPLCPLRQIRILSGNLEEVCREACQDYVTVVLTDQVDLDVFDMQDRIRSAFPNLLEIRREIGKRADYRTTFSEEEIGDPFSLCKAFLGELDPEEEALLQELIQQAQEGAV